MNVDLKLAKALEVFFSYAHEDEDLRNQLEKHLSMLKRLGVITTWYDRRIDAGQEWAGKIDEHLNTAPIILLLVSPDFLASDYCYDVEMDRAMQRYKAGETSVMAVILRPVDWEGAPFSQLQCLPEDAKPVTSWPDRDEAFKNVAQGIRKAVDKLLRKEEQKTRELLLQAKSTELGKEVLEHRQSIDSLDQEIQRQVGMKQVERWKILQDTQTKIYEIQQDVTLNQARAQDKMFNKWDEYIKS